MSELRRNGGPDDADKPAADLPKAEQPGRPRGFEIRTADQNPDWPVDRRKVTAAQKYYHELIKQAGDVPPVRETGIVYVQDWASGKSLDDKYPPVVRDKGRTKPDKAPPDKPAVDALPDELKRDKSTLEARTVEQVEDATKITRYSDVERSRRRSRGSWDKFVTKSGDLADKTGKVVDEFDKLLRPPTPSGSHAGKSYDAPAHIADQHAVHHLGDAVTAVMAVAVVGIDLSLKARKKFDSWKGEDAGNG